MGKALVFAVGGILTALLNVLLADKLKAWIPWFTQALLDLAGERLPEAQRERFAEEWASHLNDVSGDFAKIAFARGCVSAAGEMASLLGHRNRGFSGLLKRSREFLKQLSKRLVHLVSAAGALFFGEDSMLAKGRPVPTIIVFTLLSGLAGFLASYALTPKYTSQSQILVEGQKVPETMVQPVVSQDLTARMATLQQQVLSQSRLEHVVERVFPDKSSQQQGEIIEAIRLNMQVEPVLTDLSLMSKKESGAQSSPVPAFNVIYTGASPREAQQVCTELTSLLVDENLKSIQAVASGTSDVLGKGLEDAKNSLDTMDKNLAAFKKQYVGQLPGDQENNMKTLMDLNAQLEAKAQALTRAEHDKAYTESLLAEQLAAWKASQPTNTSAEKAPAMEPWQILQLRLQLHQFEDDIEAARDRKRLQQEIAVYQERISLGPAVEAQYKALARDYTNAEQNYSDLLAKKSAADLTVKMNNQSEGERMFILNPASLPDSPVFPDRWLFAVGGLSSGFGLGVGLVLWTKLRSKVGTKLLSKDVQADEEPVNLHE